MGVGALILGLRQVNISRRELVDKVPAAEPIVDAVLDRVDELAEPVSAALGALVSAVGAAVPGEPGERIEQVAAGVAEAGPQLLKLSGLTKRD